MTQVRSTKYELLTGILFLAVLMVSVISVNQRPIFAQITPTPQSVGSDKDVTESAGNSNPQPITPSAEQDATTEEEATDLTDSFSMDSGQTSPAEQGDQTTTTTITTSEEQGSSPSGRLAEAIKNEVNHALAAAAAEIINP